LLAFLAYKGFVLVRKAWLYVRDCEQFLAIYLDRYTSQLCCGWGTGATFDYKVIKKCANNL